MRALLIALGNPLRRDDGVAQAAVKMLPLDADVDSRALIQLAPETASEMASYDAVVFLDADAGAKEVRIETVSGESAAPGAITHHFHPVRVVAMSRELFQFAGQAFICRLPASNFGTGEGLSRRARTAARRAASAIEVLLRNMRAVQKPKTLHA